MKQVLAGVLYISFLLLAVRVQAANFNAAAGGTVAGQIAQANALLYHYRETARPEFVTKAQAVISAALASAPADYLAQRTAVAVLLAAHVDRGLLARITELNRRFPDDVDTYALLIDAELALGRYAQAEQHTQRLLDLRPDNLPGLIRTAHLRELYGDWQGAIDCLNASLNRVTADDAELRARLYTQLARLHFGAGHSDIAQQALAAALAVVPDYHLALEERVRIARLGGAHDVAVRDAEKLYRLAPSVPRLLVLARATAAAGELDHAHSLFRQFEREATALDAREHEAQLALSDYYADEGQDPTRALRISTALRAARADADTVVVHARALHRAGRNAEAINELDLLARLGWRDPEFRALAAAVHPAGGTDSQPKS